MAKKITTQDTQGNDKQIEIHGAKDDAPKGVKILGGRPGADMTKGVQILSKREPK